MVGQQLLLNVKNSILHALRIKDLLQSFNDFIFGGLLPLLLCPERSKVLRVLCDLVHQHLNNFSTGTEDFGDMSWRRPFELHHPDSINFLN